MLLRMLEQGLTSLQIKQPGGFHTFQIFTFSRWQSAIQRPYRDRVESSRAVESLDQVSLKGARCRLHVAGECNSKAGYGVR
jgi:hypothetical protein